MLNHLGFQMFLFLSGHSVLSTNICDKGHYLSTGPDGQEICQPCQHGSFMPKDMTECQPCTGITNPTIEVFVSQCNRTHDTFIQCIDGYFRTTDHKCKPCTKCPHPKQLCQKYSDTICCSDDGYKVYNGACVKFCRRGQYFIPGTDECVPCPPNEFMDEESHHLANCKKCDSSLKDHAMIVQNCNGTHPTLVSCLDGYYKHLTTSDQSLYTCQPCQDCSVGQGYVYVGRMCTSTSDTVCCPLPNMNVFDTPNGPECQPSNHTDTGNSSQSSQESDEQNVSVIILVSLVVVLVSIGAGLYCMRRRICRRPAREDGLTHHNSHPMVELGTSPDGTAEEAVGLLDQEPSHVTLIAEAKGNEVNEKAAVQAVGAVQPAEEAPIGKDGKEILTVDTTEEAKDTEKLPRDQDVALKVTKISKNKGRSRSITAEGHGRLVSACHKTEMYTCTCHMCTKSKVANGQWGEIFVRTDSLFIGKKKHARQIECTFSEGSVILLSGKGIVAHDLDQNICTIRFVTHDIDLIKRLSAMLEQT